jgi:excisionase family DNA binding protein
MPNAIEAITKLAAELAHAQQGSEYLTPRESAAYMHREVRSIYRAIKAGQLPASRPGGRGQLLIRREDLNRFIEGK